LAEVAGKRSAEGVTVPPEEYGELLRLSSVPGIGPNKLRILVNHFGSPSQVFQASENKLIAVGKIDAKIARRIRKYDGHHFVEQQLDRLKKTGIRLITFWDKAYPALLKQIYDPPTYLFVKGSFHPTDRHSVSIVGTRRPSNYGKRITEKLTAELAANGLTIVSGLAYGTDTLAHRTSLKSGSRTIAVLGSGADVIYPQSNVSLAEDIAQNGAVISEFPLGTKPDWMNFPRRNRIICGLSLGTVVIEAAQKSGALITAAMALEQNREVFAVPGNIDSANSLGTNNLIKQGAKVVTSVEDILEELRPQLQPLFRKSEISEIRLSLTENETFLLNILSHEPLHVDAIAGLAQQSTSQVLSTLLSLELKNVVKQHPGKLFVRI